MDGVDTPMLTSRVSILNRTKTTMTESVVRYLSIRTWKLPTNIFCPWPSEKIFVPQSQSERLCQVFMYISTVLIIYIHFPSWILGPVHQLHFPKESFPAFSGLFFSSSTESTDNLAEVILHQQTPATRPSYFALCLIIQDFGWIFVLSGVLPDSHNKNT